MTLNPITALSEQLQKLIKEHGSASILRDHLALFKDQLVLLENESINLKSKIKILETNNTELIEENQNLRQKVQKHDQSHNILLDKEKTNILLYMIKNIGDTLTFQIIQSLNMSEDIAKYHLQELHKKQFIREGLPVLPGQHSWNINDKGKKYLIENKLIT